MLVRDHWNPMIRAVIVKGRLSFEKASVAFASKLQDVLVRTSTGTGMERLHAKRIYCIAVRLIYDHVYKVWKVSQFHD